MEDFQKILETLRRNQEIAQTFFEIETKILSILNFKDFFETLLTQIEEKRNVPYVWVSLIDRSQVSDMIQALPYFDSLKGRLNLVDRDIFLSLVGHNTTPVLVNDRLDRFFKLFPEDQHYPIKSLAVAPLTLDGTIIGSLNQADDAQDRYAPSQDTSLLERLAVKVSLCLSNVMAHEQLEHLASEDPLTGVLNRRALERLLSMRVEEAKRYKIPLSVVFLDLDDLKMVNDRYGHECGDVLLQHFGKQLRTICRSSDVVARFGGDEFVVILPHQKTDEAAVFVSRVETYLQKLPVTVGDVTIPVSISSGVASLDEKTISDAHSLLRRADELLYKAKEQKKKARR